MAELTRRFHLPSAVRSTPFRIDADSARALIAEGAVAIDVRRHDDLDAGGDGLLRIAPDEIPARIDSLDRDTPIVLGCT